MRSSTATLLVRNLPHYRRDAFASGLRNRGFRVHFGPQGRPDPGDVLVIWNRYGTGERLATEYARAGAAVVIAENAYLDMHGTKKSFAVALDHHNGAGRWCVGDADRRRMLSAEVLAWRGDGTRGDVLLLPQRGIGPRGVAMPHDWIKSVERRLERAGLGDRRVRIRPHPGNAPAPRRLEDDLDGVGLCVTWASGAGVKTLLLGMPTLYEMEHWIGAPGGSRGVETLSAPRLGNRHEMLRRLAWAQWTLEEVAAGVPFEHLLALHAEMREAGHA